MSKEDLEERRRALRGNENTEDVTVEEEQEDEGDQDPITNRYYIRDKKITKHIRDR